MTGVQTCALPIFPVICGTHPSGRFGRMRWNEVESVVVNEQWRWLARDGIGARRGRTRWARRLPGRSKGRPRPEVGDGGRRQLAVVAGRGGRRRTAAAGAEQGTAAPRARRDDGRRREPRRDGDGPGEQDGGSTSIWTLRSDLTHAAAIPLRDSRVVVPSEQGRRPARERRRPAGARCGGGRAGARPAGARAGGSRVPQSPGVSTSIWEKQFFN